MSTRRCPIEPKPSKHPIWISEVDPQGNPVESRFLNAAYDHGGSVLGYRQNELQDMSLAVQLLERATHAAARSGESVRHPWAVIRLKYFSFVDRCLARQRRFDASLPADLDQVSGPDYEELEAQLERGLTLDQVLSHMDEDTRQICYRKLLEVPESEIARSLGISPQCLSNRFRRGCDAALAKLFKRKRS